MKDKDNKVNKIKSKVERTKHDVDDVATLKRLVSSYEDYMADIRKSVEGSGAFAESKMIKLFTLPKQVRSVIGTMVDTEIELTNRIENQRKTIISIKTKMEEVSLENSRVKHSSNDAFGKIQSLNNEVHKLRALLFMASIVSVSALTVAIVTVLR